MITPFKFLLLVGFFVINTATAQYNIQDKKLFEAVFNRDGSNPVFIEYLKFWRKF